MAAGWCETLAKQESLNDVYFDTLATENMAEKQQLVLMMRDFLGEDRLLKHPELRSMTSADALLMAVFGKHEEEMAQKRKEISKLEETLASTRGTLTDTRKSLYGETARANRAETDLAEMAARREALLASSAAQAAEAETSAEAYWGMAADSATAVALHERRLVAATPALLGMLRQTDQPASVALGAQLLEGLGIFSRDGVAEQLETDAMGREEHAQRRGEALEKAKAAGGGAAGGGKGKGKKGKGKGKKSPAKKRR